MGFVLGFDRIAAEIWSDRQSRRTAMEGWAGQHQDHPRRTRPHVGVRGRTQPSQGIALDLYAKAMAVQDESGNRAVLVTSDLIGFRTDFAEPTCQRISEKTGLRRDQILLNSSHTHTGPTLALDEADSGVSAGAGAGHRQIHSLVARSVGGTGGEKPRAT